MLDLNGPDSHAVVARIRSGDAAAFEELFRAAVPVLLPYAERLTGSRSAAEDVVQEVFFLIWRRREAFELHGALLGYLLSAVHNRALDSIRNDRVRTRAYDELGAESQAYSPPADVDVQRAQLAAVVLRTIAALPDRAREVFTLSRERGLTNREIADRLGIAVKTVEMHMARALRGLRDAVKVLR